MKNLFTIGMLGSAAAAGIFISGWLAAMLAVGAFVLRDA